jgi:methanogenic corrinoid protein MtbC1
MIDMPFPVRAVEGDSQGQARGLSQAALMVLAQEVITHLSRRALPTGSLPQGVGRSVTRPNLDAFCAELVGRDADAPRRTVLAAHATGASHEDLCVFYIADAARRLGVMWEDDEISFSDMAVAAGRMLHLLRDLRDLAPVFEPRGDRCALIATVPGETHSLGATMAADLFRDRGWDIDLRMGQNETQLAETLRKGGYPIVGLSASTADRLRALGRVVVELRLVAPKVLIFVGGGIARLDPDIAVRVGADAAAWDMEDCVSEMERLYALAL